MNNDQNEILKDFAFFLTIAYEVVAWTVVPAMLGFYLKKKGWVTDWMVVIAIFLGFVLSMVRILRKKRP